MSDSQLVAPLDVFSVVKTTGTILGRRSHRVCPPLYETRAQAEAALPRLLPANGGTDTYDVWKHSTYIEPAGWMSDVVMADGTIVRSNP